MSFNPKTKLFLDTETSGIQPFHGDRPFMVQLGDDDCNTKIYEWPVDPFTREVFPNKRDIKEIKSLTMDPSLEKESYNRKFDQRMLEMTGIGFAGTFHDCFLKARVCRTTEFSYVLEELAAKYGDYPKDDSEYVHKCATKARAIGRKNGWNLYKFGRHPERADYWMIALAGIDPVAVREYGEHDIRRLYVLHHLYEEVFQQDPARLMAYNREMGLFPEVYAMENRGICISPERNEEQRIHYTEAQKKYLAECQEIAVKDKKVWWNNEKRGRDRYGNLKPVAPFNPASPQQITRLLYTKQPYGYGLKCTRYTKKSKSKPLGGESADYRALREYQNVPIVRVLTLCNGAKKAREFFDQYKALMVEEKLNGSPLWVIHASFDQGGAKTLRFSSREPNLQQAAKGGGVSKTRSRGPFQPRPGYVFFMFDYANQEARIFAEISQIPELVEACTTPGKDVNTVLANKIWGGKGNPKAFISAARALELGNEKPTNKLVIEAREALGWQNEWCSLGVTSQMALKFADKFLWLYNYDIVKAEKAVDPEQSSFTRTRAKNVLFAKLYGGGADAVKDFMFCSQLEAKQMLEEFDAAWPGIVAAMNSEIASVRRCGFVETLYGNKLDVDPGFEYKGINYLVQGTAAAMMKDSMLRCARYLRRTKLDAHMVMTVHDELVFEIKKEHAYPWLIRGIRNIMENNGGRIKSLPMVVEAARATERWDEKEAVIFTKSGLKFEKKQKSKTGKWIPPSGKNLKDYDRKLVKV
jgi:DNA polymerase I-like protein with 3'-5' exonuclease and polymerase domains